MANLIQENKLLPLCSIILSSCIQTAVAAKSPLNESGVLDYNLSLAEDGETYEVWMLPSVTPKPDLSLTGQITIRVPNSAAFKVASLKNHIEDADWIEAARTDAPVENPDYDYISFSFVGLSSRANFYQWKADEEKLIFSFRNEQGCVSDVSLLDEDDPFNVLDNSAGTRPGNQFTNIGWGSVDDNHFRSNYGKPINCS